MIAHGASKVTTKSRKTYRVASIVVVGAVAMALGLLWWLVSAEGYSHVFGRVVATAASPNGRYEVVVRFVDYGGSISECPDACGGVHSEAFLIDTLRLFGRERRIALPSPCGPDGSSFVCQENLAQLNWGEITALPTATTW